MTFAPPSPPYLGPAAHDSGPFNKPIRRLVIHSTVSACEPGMARRIAAYFRSEKAGGSAHYVIDPGEVVQVVLDSVVAWHAPPNPRTLGLEMCEHPARNWLRFFGGKTLAEVKAEHADSTTVAFNPFRWMSPNYRRMYRLTADLAADLCLAYDLPPRWVGAKAMRKTPDIEGITTHAATSAAFRQSSHWDPGVWPRRAFVRRVRKIVERRKAAALEGRGLR